MKKLIEDYQIMLKGELASFKKVLEAGGNILLDRFNLLSEDKKAEAHKQLVLYFCKTQCHLRSFS